MGSGPLKMRRRADLVAVAQRMDWSRRWAIKDPISLDYFHLGDQEWFLLQQLDGQSTLEEIQDRFDAAFAPQRITTARLVSFFRQLHQNGMLLVDQFGQSDVLLDQSASHRRKQWLGQVLSPLAIRFRGVDAGPILNWLRPLGSVLFHPLFAVLLVVAWMAALVLVVAQSDQLTQRIPTLAEFFTGRNFVLLLLTMSAVKICHELGHGLACRHFGGECHEIGVMLLALTPCLYCNVSDAWMMPKRWHRIIVSAAGMYVELILAAGCVFLWYFSVPSTLNTLCLNTVLVCSVSTLVFNGNPLLRYDGYFILADLWNVPNLFEQSRQATWTPIKNWLGGTRPEHPPWDLPRYWLVCYGLLSAAYRLTVISTILYVLYHGLSAGKLRPLADVIAAVTFVGLLTPLFKNLFEMTNPHSRFTPIPWSRWAFSLCLALILGCALFYWPAPRHLRAPIVMQSVDAEYVYAPFAGHLRQYLRPGDNVTKGQTIAELRNSELEQELIEARSDTKRLERELENLRFRSNLNPIARAATLTSAASLQAAKNRQLTVENNIRRLTIRATSDGVVIPGPYRASSRTDDDLPSWEGCPLDINNQHCFVDAGDLLCLVGEPNAVEALVYVLPQDVTAVTVGSQVSLHLDQLPGRTIPGKVIEVSQGEVPLSDQTRRDNRDTAIGQDGAMTSRESSHFLRVQLNERVPGVRHGSGGFAKVTVEGIPLGIRFLRYLRRMFQFHL